MGNTRASPAHKCTGYSGKNSNECPAGPHEYAWLLLDASIYHSARSERICWAPQIETAALIFI